MSPVVLRVKKGKRCLKYEIKLSFSIVKEINDKRDFLFVLIFFFYTKNIYLPIQIKICFLFLYPTFI